EVVERVLIHKGHYARRDAEPSCGGQHGAIHRRYEAPNDSIPVPLCLRDRVVKPLSRKDCAARQRCKKHWTPRCRIRDEPPEFAPSRNDMRFVDCETDGYSGDRDGYVTHKNDELDYDLYPSAQGVPSGINTEQPMIILVRGSVYDLVELVRFM